MEGRALRLRGHVHELAGTIGERSLWRPEALARAAAYVGRRLAAHGTVEEQAFEVDGRRVANVELTLPGRGTGSVVVGAHYDTVLGSPGANDNGSGVAALLELAGALAAAPRARTLRLVAFVNEEPPFFQTEAMGSLRYARRCRERGEGVEAMLSLESIGCYRDAPGSQSYPAGLGLLYPDRGDFVAFVSNLGSARLLRRAVRAFRGAVDLPCQAAALPAAIPGVGWSDQWAFWEHGYPALMVTDTAPFRDPWYHTAGDTEEKLDYERLGRVVEGLAAAISELAGAGVPSSQTEPSA
jgi:Zn-dependent M28 family amino/carboxypeptidase